MINTLCLFLELKGGGGPIIIGRPEYVWACVKTGGQRNSGAPVDFLKTKAQNGTLKKCIHLLSKMPRPTFQIGPIPFVPQTGRAAVSPFARLFPPVGQGWANVEGIRQRMWGKTQQGQHIGRVAFSSADVSFARGSEPCDPMES